MKFKLIGIKTSEMTPSELVMFLNGYLSGKLGWNDKDTKETLNQGLEIIKLCDDSNIELKGGGRKR